MKINLHQQLQSRISQRSNFIRYMEQQVAIANCRVNSNRRELKEALAELRKDQTLDKRLSAVIVREERNMRFYRIVAAAT